MMSMLATYAGRSEENLPAEAAGIMRERNGLPLALAMIRAMLREEPPRRWADVLDSLTKADWEEIRLEFPNYLYPSLVAAIGERQGSPAGGAGALFRSCGLARRYAHSRDCSRGPVGTQGQSCARHRGTHLHPICCYTRHPRPSGLARPPARLRAQARGQPR